MCGWADHDSCFKHLGQTVQTATFPNDSWCHCCTMSPLPMWAAPCKHHMWSRMASSLPVELRRRDCRNTRIQLNASSRLREDRRMEESTRLRSIFFTAGVHLPVKIISDPGFVVLRVNVLCSIYHRCLIACVCPLASTGHPSACTDTAIVVIVVYCTCAHVHCSHFSRLSARTAGNPRASRRTEQRCVQRTPPAPMTL